MIFVGLVPNQLYSCTMSKKMQSIFLYGSGLSGLGILEN
jgi:hypothetical protein